MKGKYKYLMFTMVFLLLPLSAMLLNITIPIYMLPQYLVSTSLYIGGIGFTLSVTILIIKSRKEMVRKTIGKTAVVVIILLLASNLYLYHIVSYDFYQEGWYGKATKKDVSNGKYYVIFNLNGIDIQQECTKDAYGTIITGRKYMAESYGNTKLKRNVIYKVEEQEGE